MEAVGNKNNLFTHPSVEKEMGEVERVARELNLGGSFVPDFIERSKRAQLTDLSEDDWSKLENTDSFDISFGDWEKVAYHAEHENRDWESLRSKMESRTALDAPVVVKIGLL